MGILVIAEHDNHSIKAATLNALSAAVQLGGEVTLLVAGNDCGAAVEAGARINGVSRLLHADAPHYEHGLVEELAPLVAACCDGMTHALAPADTFGKNLMPRVAALLDVGMVADIVSIESADTFVRPIYAGNALATVKSNDAVKVITVRTTNFDAVAAEGGAAAVATAGDLPGPVGLSGFVSLESPESERPELTSAKIVLSGGRGFGSGENFPPAGGRGRQAGRSCRRLPRRGRCGLRIKRLPGRPDRQDRRARPVRCGGYLRRHPAPGRYEGKQGDRRHQQGRGGAYLRGCGLRPGRRPCSRPCPSSPPSWTSWNSQPCQYTRPCGRNRNGTSTPPCPGGSFYDPGDSFLLPVRRAGQMADGNLPGGTGNLDA